MVERVTHEIYHKVQQRCIMGWQIMQISTLANDMRITCYFTYYFMRMSVNSPHMYVLSMTDPCMHEIMCLHMYVCLGAGLCVSSQSCFPCLFWPSNSGSFGLSDINAELLLSMQDPPAGGLKKEAP